MEFQNFDYDGYSGLNSSFCFEDIFSISKSFQRQFLVKIRDIIAELYN